MPIKLKDGLSHLFFCFYGISIILSSKEKIKSLCYEKYVIVGFMFQYWKRQSC